MRRISRAGTITASCGRGRRWRSAIRERSPPGIGAARADALRGLHPELQLQIYADGEFVARVDFGFEERLVVEYDGEWHGQGSAIARDRVRQNKLRQAGWQIHFVTKEMMVNPDAVIDEI